MHWISEPISVLDNEKGGVYIGRDVSDSRFSKWRGRAIVRHVAFNFGIYSVLRRLRYDHRMSIAGWSAFVCIFCMYFFGTLQSEPFGSKAFGWQCFF